MASVGLDKHIAESCFIFKSFIFVLFALITAPPLDTFRQNPYNTSPYVVLHFINSNIRVLNVQRTSPMRIAFTVLANTELSSTRVTKIKVTWRSKKRLPITTKGRDVVHKTQNKKLYNI